MGFRSRTLHFALSRTVLEWNIRFGTTNKHTAIQCQQQSDNLDKVHFWIPPTTFNCMENFSEGQNFSFPALFDCYRELFLITISPNKCQMRVLTRTKMRYCSIVYTFYGGSQHQFFIFDFVFCTRYPCYSDLLLTCVSETVHKTYKYQIVSDER